MCILFGANRKDSMIKKVEIFNFKSIEELPIELGRVNIIIGENGCGKTNLLEAIAFASLASHGPIIQETVGRKFRYVAPEFMLPAFADLKENNLSDRTISIKVYGSDGLPKNTTAIYDPKGKEWMTLEKLTDNLNLAQILKEIKETNSEAFEELTNSLKHKEQFMEALQSENFLSMYMLAPELFSALRSTMIDKPELNTFMIYNPEESKLRQFSDEAWTYPLGRNGEGLFQYLKEIHDGEKRDVMERIVQKMSLLDWVDGTSIPDDLLSNEYRLKIGDKYLKESLHYFDQRSTNEGFLFLLFYMTLFSSPDTPPFFAIDNIESAFNPKLCTELIRTIVQLAKDNQKQVIMTTHSPYVLDGLDLSDDDQRLFVARRNKDGHTVIKRIPAVKGLKMRLSEVWMKGMIGGLPDNF